MKQELEQKNLQNRRLVMGIAGVGFFMAGLWEYAFNAPNARDAIVNSIPVCQQSVNLEDFHYSDILLAGINQKSSSELNGLMSEPRFGGYRDCLLESQRAIRMSGLDSDGGRTALGVAGLVFGGVAGLLGLMSYAGDVGKKTS